MSGKPDARSKFNRTKTTKDVDIMCPAVTFADLELSYPKSMMIQLGATHMKTKKPPC